MIKENIWSFSNTKKPQAERRQIEPEHIHSILLCQEILKSRCTASMSLPHPFLAPSVKPFLKSLGTEHGRGQPGSCALPFRAAVTGAHK